jgi:competence protein ComEA
MRAGWSAKAMRVLALGLALAVSGSALAAKRKTQVELSGVINLNQATASQLDLLPGVGAKAAERIIEHRKKAPFKRIEELVNVKGFGKKRFDKLKAHLAVSGGTTLQARKREGDATGQARAAPPKR